MIDYFFENAVLSGVIGLVWYALLAAGLWKMFDKAGEAGWKAIVPFYNVYILFKISWQTAMFWAMILCGLGGAVLYAFGYMNGMMMLIYVSYALSILGAIIKAVLCYNISLAYGHGLGYFFGLYLFDAVFIMVLGFGASRYAGNRYSRENAAASTMRF